MPPRYGKLNLAEWAKSVPTINGFKTEPWLLKGAQILSINMEVDDDPADNLLPATMHPSIPEYAIFNVTSYPDTPVGAFSIAEVRLSGRTGVRPRGFVLRSYCNNEDARRELAARWGYPTVVGDVKIDIRHDRVVARVSADDKPVLQCELIDRDTISGGDIQYIASMHLARNKEDGKLVLVQVDPEFVFSKAERGKPRINLIDNDAFGANNYLRLDNPISATFTTADVTVPKIRYICNPELPAMQGTTKVAA
jgi:Acetoacetate decarboxylase (ADC)